MRLYDTTDATRLIHVWDLRRFEGNKFKYLHSHLVLFS